MGMILGKMLGETLSQSMIVMDMQWWLLFESPIVCLFFALAAITILWPVISAWRRRG